MSTEASERRRVTASYISIIVPPFQGLRVMLDFCPGASLADSLYPGLFSFGPSALPDSLPETIHKLEREPSLSLHFAVMFATSTSLPQNGARYGRTGEGGLLLRRRSISISAYENDRDFRRRRLRSGPRRRGLRAEVWAKCFRNWFDAGCESRHKTQPAVDCPASRSDTTPTSFRAAARRNCWRRIPYAFRPRVGGGTCRSNRDLIRPFAPTQQ